MIRLFALLVLLEGLLAQDIDVGLGVTLDLGLEGPAPCVDIKSQGRFLDRSLAEVYIEQPFFVTFLPKTGDNDMVDNICYTYFALPDNPLTFQMYISRVYCDGSTSITSHVITQCELGVFRSASPYCTFTDTAFAYAGCDTFLNYRCILHGDCKRDCEEGLGGVYGISTLCRPMGLSCLKKVEEVIRDHCIPEQEYYVLPMQLPNKCVTSQICINEPPAVEFQRAVGLPLERPRRRLL